ncbi:hypothetical protein [Thiolapillus sp.]|uniref:hypothetical protein n=1 Tax=Thiolapillus sp. TaxID=2017437 RepID=UPI003AF74619
MTLVLLDTNAYLRLAKRIKPLLGIRFGQKGYVLTILKDVEDEVHRSARLQEYFPWFDDPPLQQERLAKRVRLSRDEKAQITAMKSVLRQHALAHAADYTTLGRSPPSPTDCLCLAFGQVRQAIVATDDLGMHKLAEDFELPIFHCHEVLKKMLTAKAISKELVTDIYHALEVNGDLPRSWVEVKHTAFKKVFGLKPKHAASHGERSEGW